MLLNVRLEKPEPHYKVENFCAYVFGDVFCSFHTVVSLQSREGTCNRHMINNNVTDLF